MDDCIFCKIIKGEIPCFKVYEDDKVLAFEDINPVDKGHTLIVPKRHAENLWEISGDDLGAIHLASQKVVRAIKEALDAIPMQLTFEVRKIPEFQLKTGIIEVRGSEIIIELGRDLGLKTGDEYVIVSSEILQAGRALSREQGLVVIKEVSDEVSVAKIIYARPRPQIGDQLQEALVDRAQLLSSHVAPVDAGQRLSLWAQPR